MGILDQLFRRQSNPSAKVAKERLQIIVAHQRNGRAAGKRNEPEFMEDMKREILLVVKKYINIHPDDIEANISKEGGMDVLALNINLPEKNDIGTIQEAKGAAKDKPHPTPES